MQNPQNHSTNASVVEELASTPALFMIFTQRLSAGYTGPESWAASTS